MGDLLKSVQRVLSIQEQRQAEYSKLKKAHEDYSSLTVTLFDYQKAMADITASFQSLSQEMIQLSSVFREHSLPQSAQILDQIQTQEKLKLTLTVEQQQILASTSEEQMEDLDSALHAHKLKTFRQELRGVEGTIADLVQDLRYECEHVLVTVLEQTS